MLQKKIEGVIARILFYGNITCQLCFQYCQSYEYLRLIKQILPFLYPMLSVVGRKKQKRMRKRETDRDRRERPISFYNSWPISQSSSGSFDAFWSDCFLLADTRKELHCERVFTVSMAIAFCISSSYWFYDHIFQINFLIALQQRGFLHNAIKIAKDLR